MYSEDLNKVLQKWEIILREKFNKKPEEALEVFLLLATAHMYSIQNPNQLSQKLGVDKNQIYSQLKNWRSDELRKIYVELGSEVASEELKRLEKMSPSSHTRYKPVLSVDDTVIDRMGKLMPMTYSWYSGRWKQVVKGQNIIAITIKIGERIIPLAIRPVSKQGRGNTDKPQVFRSMLHEVLNFFRKEGVDLPRLPITFDSWYGKTLLVDELRSFGFQQIHVHSKSNWVFDIDSRKCPISQHKKEVKLEKKWGCKDKLVKRVQAFSPTFGLVIILFFWQEARVNALIVFGDQPRACEIVSVWDQHHSIEVFWRRLKTDFSFHNMKLRGTLGGHVTLAVKLLAYLLFENLSQLTHSSFYFLSLSLPDQVPLSVLLDQHFHQLLP